MRSSGGFYVCAAKGRAEGPGATFTPEDHFLHGGRDPREASRRTFASAASPDIKRLKRSAAGFSAAGLPRGSRK